MSQCGFGHCCRSVSHGILRVYFAGSERSYFARREAKTRIRQRDWLKLAGEKIRREQVGSVPTFFVCSREQIRLVENGLKKDSARSALVLGNIGIFCNLIQIFND